MAPEAPQAARLSPRWFTAFAVVAGVAIGVALSDFEPIDAATAAILLSVVATSAVLMKASGGTASWRGRNALAGAVLTLAVLAVLRLLPDALGLLPLAVLSWYLVGRLLRRTRPSSPFESKGLLRAGIALTEICVVTSTASYVVIDEVHERAERKIQRTRDELTTRVRAARTEDVLVGDARAELGSFQRLQPGTGTISFVVYYSVDNDCIVVTRFAAGMVESELLSDPCDEV